MDGILLAGGMGTRLHPSTLVTNKHLLPVYDKPMIFYGLQMLADMGVENLTIVLGGNSVGDIVNLVKDGEKWGLRVDYVYQREAYGISHAISICRPRTNKFLVLLGDNIFNDYSDTLVDDITAWSKVVWGEALIVLTDSTHPQDYGQPIFEGQTIVDFVEKSKAYIGPRIVTGLYGLTQDAFRIISKQKLSQRGELEIVDTLRGYKSKINPIGYEGFWSDCGTADGLVEASKHIMESI